MQEPVVNDDVVTRIRDYWDQRAPGYTLATRISYVDDEYTMNIFSHFVNLGRHMRIADMGTGCGLMAMWLASMGHEVVAVDNSGEMLAEAGRNVRDADLEIEFVEGDIQRPPLEKESFDMVVAKSSVWCLPHPSVAYCNWKDLLKPGGYIVVVDGNYYLDLFDEDYRKRREYFDMLHGRETGLHYKTNINNVDTNIIREIAKELPLSRERRPSWDVSTMLGIGMTDIHVKSLDVESYSTLTEAGMTCIPNMFIMVARKPFRNMSPRDVAAFEPPVVDGLMPTVAARLRSCGTEEVSFFKALADPKRLDIVRALESGRMSTSALARVLDTSPSMVSHNLAILRDQGIVVSERNGKEIINGLSNPSALAEILEISSVIRSSESVERA